MLKDFITFLIMPFTVTMTLIVIGVIFLWLRRNRKGIILITTGFFLLYFFSSWFGSWLLLNPLESRYPPLVHPEQHQIENVVVLSGGHEDHPGLPATLQIRSGSMYRIIEGARIHRQLPGSRLILLGGTGQRHAYTSEVLVQLLEETGIQTDEVIFVNGASNTEQEAEFITELLENGSEVILVTSARHMYRSMLLFKGQGLNPVPAPTQLELRGNTKHFPVALEWNPKYLGYSHQAVYEYVGIAWAWVRGKI